MYIMEIKYFIGIVIIHWIADFLLQNDKMALYKSTSLKWLFIHTSVYSIVWFFCCIPILGVFNSIAFALITFLIHSLQDAITSRINSHLYKNDKRHWFFVCIGLDQVLHYIQLVITINYLLNK